MAVTVQELNDASVDCQTLEDVVNGAADRANPGQANGTVTSRLGRVNKTVAKALLDFFNLYWKGAWALGTTYAVGELVSHDGSTYISKIANNVGLEPDANPAAWDPVALKGNTGATGPAGTIGAIGSNLDMGNTYKMINHPDPAGDTDSVNKRYVDFADASAELTAAANWTKGSNRLYRSPNRHCIVEATFTAGAAAGSSLANTTVGYRPAVVTALCATKIVGTGALGCVIDSAGNIILYGTIAEGDQIVIGGSYKSM